MTFDIPRPVVATYVDDDRRLATVVVMDQALADDAGAALAPAPGRRGGRGPSDQVPPQVQAHGAALGSRGDVEVDISGYGRGGLPVVVLHG